MYTLLPFNFSHFVNQILLTNDCGEFALISKEAFSEFIKFNLDPMSDVFYELKSKYFLCFQKDIDIVIELMGVRLRTKKAFLKDFTVLHMIVPTLACNSHCTYCQASSVDLVNKTSSMTSETIKKTIDIIMKSPSNYIKIEIQGGEPLLRFDLVKEILYYSLKQSIIHRKILDFVICTNLILVTKEMLLFFKRYNIYISTSLDGPKSLHDYNRPLRNGESSFDLFKSKLIETKDILGDDHISCLLTVTKKSLPLYKEIINQYLNFGFSRIFIRMLNPYGEALKNYESIGYSTDDFIDFYSKALDYIIELNLNGSLFREEFASLILRKLLTPFSTGFVDLQSPSGLGISCAIYNYDGSVYCSDEGRMLAEMGVDHFVIGNVLHDDYSKIFNSEKLKNIIKDSIAESSPICSVCVFLPYCGSDPVRNWKEGNSYTRKSNTNSFCEKNKKLISLIIEKFLLADKKTKNILSSWAS